MLMRLGVRRDIAPAVGRLRRGIVSVPLWVQRIQNRRELPVRMYWWRPASGFQNFGDELAADIILRLWGLRCTLTPVRSCELVAVGSLMELTIANRGVDQPLAVWGTGFIEPGRKVEVGAMSVFAVRGPVTARRLGIKPRRLALGDPGLLASRVFKRSGATTHQVGIVVHYVDENHPALDAVRSDPRFRIIDARQSPRRVVEEITACRLILSSSLHGIIVAESFGIPSYWTPLSNDVAGGRYKFRDYYRGTGRRVAKRSLDDLLVDDAALSRAVEEYVPITDLRRRQNELIRSFPLNRMVDISVRRRVRR